MSSEDAAATGDSAGQADADHENALQDVIAVDPEDVEQGTVNRLDAHTGDGIRHRAFTCLVYDTRAGSCWPSARPPSDSGTLTGTERSPPIRSRGSRRRTRPNSALKRSWGSPLSSTTTFG